jgi:CMP-N,N'-diacetyllegionaminic acid synthase
MTRKVALIPARSGSKRIQNKNIRELNGHPLLAYSVLSAIESEVFDSVICATDSEIYADIAQHYGAEAPFLRSSDISGDKSPDIEWVEWILNALEERGQEFEVFSILRPTSPFRSSKTIQRAMEQFLNAKGADSLRAVEKCGQHPGKMWVIQKDKMLPLMPHTLNSQPWHSNQYAVLPEIYVQNASLEIAWTRVVKEGRTIAGESLIPFITEGVEGFDVNEEFDWWKVEQILATTEYGLHKIKLQPWKQ